MEEKLKTSKGLKQKILLVEGNNINRRIMRELLKKMNLDITEAKDGLEAIELAKKESFDMIFMDIFMPGMNGQETINRIRELDDFSREIPIIAVTANYDEETQEKIMAMGMNGVLSKPLRKESLENLLNEHFSNIDNGGDNAMYDLEIFNKNKFELLYDNDDFRKEIINTFFDEKQNNLQNISNALKSNDCALIHKAFHYMKGSFSYLNAPKILELTQQILNLSTENRIHDVLLLEEPFLDNYHLLIRELSIYMSNKTF